MSAKLIRATLALGAIALACFVALGKKPWETKWADRVAAGKVPGLNDYFETGMWWAAVANLVILLGLLFFSLWWLQKYPSPRPPQTAKPRLKKIFWLALLAIVGLSLVPRLPRIHQSFWGDEDWAFRLYVHGKWLPQEEDDWQGELEFHETPLMRTFFYDKDKNNHYLFSGLQRATLAAWRAATGQPRWAFDETVGRLVPFLAGIASIALAAWLLAREVSPGTGLATAALLAVHPMHVRYCVEARGYTLLVLFQLASIAVLLAALRRGGWPRWGLFALLQLLALYSWKADLYPMVALNLLALGLILKRHWHQRPVLAGQFWKWFVCNSLAAAAFLQLYAPNHPQVILATQTQLVQKGKPMDLNWLGDSLSELAFGLHTIEGVGSPGTQSLQEAVPLGGGIGWAAAALWAALILLGAIALARRSKDLALIFGSLFAGAVLATIHSKFGLKNELHYWYLFFLVPPVCAFAASAAQALAHRLRHGRGIAYALPVLALLPLVFGELHTRCQLPFEDLRRSASFARGQAGGQVSPNSPEVDPHATSIYLWRWSPLYDPRGNDNVRTRDALLAEIEKARAEDRGLTVSLGNAGFTRDVTPGLTSLLDDPAQFAPPTTLHGGEELVTLHLYRMKP